MGATSPAVDQAHFRNLSPLDRLRPDLVEELLMRSRIMRLPPGRRLFARGDADGETVFLLSGQVALVADGPAIMLRADSSEARVPLGDSQPREHTAISHSAATVLCVDTGVLNDLLRRSEGAQFAAPRPAAPAVAPEPAAGPAPVGILDTQPFAGLPAAHLQVLKARTIRRHVDRGETVVTRGEPGRYFFAIETGRFHSALRRRSTPDAGGRELLPGDDFGADALIANTTHETTVTALEAGTLLQLSKGEFLTLVIRHHIRRIAWRDLAAQAADGSVLLDIRARQAWQRGHLKGSVNFPLPILARAAFTLDKARCYIVCSDNTRRSAAAAWLLARHGHKTRILIEGVRAALRPG